MNSYILNYFAMSETVLVILGPFFFEVDQEFF